MMTQSSFCLFLVGALGVLNNGVGAFAPRTTTTLPSAPTLSQRAAVVDPSALSFTAESVDQARTAFFIWLFGASGGAGIARSAFPRMYRNTVELRQLKGVGPSQRGETIGLSFLCGYPQDISVADIQQVLNNKLNVQQIVEKYPVENNFLSARGYLTYEAYKRANNSNANPLAVRAIFDALGTASDVCNPEVAQDILTELKQDPKSVATRVLVTKLKGYSAIFLLLFLLALADYEAFVVHFREGWFPEWPGLSDLPGSLFSSETGLTAIPKYWLGEYK